MFTPRKCGIARKVQWSDSQKLEEGEKTAIQLLNEAINALGWTLDDAAKFSGKSLTTLWRWSNGLATIDAGVLSAICREAYGTGSIRVIPTKTGEFPCVADERRKAV